jgi:hypothetical protein
MKHKFHGQPCIYCGADADITTDHAVGKKFFLEEQRGNLPQVPACRRCNNRKSELEAYLMTVLPFGAKHAGAAELLTKLVPPRLEKNAKLARKLGKGYKRSGGTSIPFEHKPMEELFAMIAKALAFRRFDIRLENGYSAIASLFTNEGEAFFQQMLASGTTHVSGDLGAGTFTYEGAQAKDDPKLTMWRFRIYGGVDFGGDPNVYGASSLAIAVTGRPELIGNLFYSSFLKDRNAPKVGRNEPCPCGSGKKHKKCHGSVVKVEGRERMLAHAAARRVVPSTYQPIAAHGYGPHQVAEMVRYAEQMRSARSFLPVIEYENPFSAGSDLGPHNPL